MASGPRINDRFPVKESLSPPIVGPVSDCAEAVYVSGFVPHALVRVYAGATELLAEEEPPFGFSTIALKRPVKKDESITATQTIGSTTSLHSVLPAIVAALPESAIMTTKPDVGGDLFECGVVVPVGNLVPGGVRVHVTERDPAPGGTTPEIGSEPAAQAWHPVFTQALHAGHFVSARQVACEGTSHETSGPPANEVNVKSAPSPTPPPDQPDAQAMIPGNDAVTLTGLFVGAGVEIFDSGTSVCSGWFATGSANFFPVSPPLSGGPVTATQQLCGPPSKESDPARPEGKLGALMVLEPICAGSRFVILRGSQINANIVIFRNGSIVGYAGSAPGDVVAALSGNNVLNAGDIVTPIQYIDSIISPPSNDGHVVARLNRPVIEILGGEPFFIARANEQPIDGPVFPRGRGGGPSIRVQACCSKGITIEIIDANGKVVAKLPPTELIPGYFTAVWPWSSGSGWTVPTGIPVGRYEVVVHTACDQEEARAPFYVIFNPADVGGPPRFSFDDTAIWFVGSSNTVSGLHYFLHQSDQRIFSIAIKAVSGMTDSYEATIAAARAEENLFGYTIVSGANDVIDQLLNRTVAQCADDACFLVAMLRAVGIPAHPVTADASDETGAANWRFDTWVEFLAPHEGATDWRALHPHQYPGMLPESRGTFGTTRGVATKEFNDIIVMANESWPFAALDDNTPDASFGRNECGEPQQHITKAGWIDELCEQGYWLQPHWDCAGVQPRSLRAGEGFRFSGRDLSFGGHLSGTVHLVNPAEGRLFGRLIVELVSVRHHVKAIAVASFGEIVIPMVALDPDRSLSIPFSFKLPETLAPGYELYLRARLDERTAAMQRLLIQPRVSVQLDAPRRYLEGEGATIRAIVSNLTIEPLERLMVELITPFALKADERATHSIGYLAPHESREIAWPVRALAHLQSGSVHVSVATANGGGVLIRRHFTIVRRKTPIEAQPAHNPRKKPRRRLPGRH